MAQHLEFLNSRELKTFYKMLEDQFGYAGKLDGFVARAKDRYFLFSKDLERIDLAGLRVDSMGLYIGTLFEGQLRLSIEGSQLIGPFATKNVIDITVEQMSAWLEGQKLDIPVEAQGAFVLIRCKSDHLGCGKVVGEVIANYIPKTRYIHARYEME